MITHFLVVINLKKHAIVMHIKDNVATALHEISQGTDIRIDLGNSEKQIKIVETIPFGHKLAIKNIQKGDNIIKYGEQIGEAIKKIETGKLVHVHNVVNNRARKYEK